MPANSRATSGTTSEERLIPHRDLQILQSFDSHGRVTVSAYLPLDTPQRRESAYADFMQEMHKHLEACHHQPECQEAIKEDMEIVGLYLKTNGHRHQGGVAIFSCAAELFWRAYALPVPPATRVEVGEKFCLEPLLKGMA